MLPTDRFNLSKTTLQFLGNLHDLRKLALEISGDFAADSEEAKLWISVADAMIDAAALLLPPKIRN